jgi:HD-GYP domain-containing protein (c-di-GMP phosphodiesterase class II)
MVAAPHPLEPTMWSEASTPLGTNSPQTNDLEALRLSDVVSALTFALDITEGQPEGHALRSCMIGMRVGEELGLTMQQRSDLYYALLLKDLGCSSNAAKISTLFGADDQTVKKHYKTANLGELSGGVKFVLGTAGANQPLQKRIKHILDVSLGRGGGTQALMELRCERGASIAQHIGFSEAISEAIRALDEHWDGAGHPYKLAGEQIPLLGRILCLSQTVEVFFQSYGVEAARDMAKNRSGSWFDPHVVKAFLNVQESEDFWETLASKELPKQVAALEPRDKIILSDEAQLDRVAEAFSQVIDAKSPWTYKHSEGVRRFAVGAATQLEFEPQRLRELSRAALLHDLGKLSIPNTILDKPGKLTSEEFAVIRKHPEYTEQIMKRVKPFESLAVIAGAHHERMDGRGYHKGIPASTLPLEARLLAVADQFEALTATRPYRKGLSTEEALALIAKDAGQGVCKISLGALERFIESTEE